MHKIAKRRKKLFSGAKFTAALFCNEDAAKGPSPCFSYFSGCNVDGSCLVLKKNKGVLFTSRMNYSQAKKVSYYPVKVPGKKPGKELKKACGSGKVAICAYEISAKEFLSLKRKTKLKLVDESKKMHSARGQKSGNEVAKLAASARVARKILAKLKPWKYKTEKKLANALKIMALKAGAEISFEPIAATGKNSSFPHHSPGKAKLQDFVLVDFGVKYNGYCSDLTRCYFRKRKMREEEAYEKCKKVFDEMLIGLSKCKTGKHACRLSEKLMEKHKLPEMIHSVGHGIGIEVHEFPRIGKKSKDLLSGTVIAIEPASYFKGFGVRFEDMLVNTKKGWKRI